MRRLTKLEMEKKKMAMRVRAALRLEANERYVENLNEILPEAEKRFDKSLQEGKTLKAIDIGKILGG